MYDTDEGEGESGGKNEEMLVTKRELGKSGVGKTKAKAKGRAKKGKGKNNSSHPVSSTKKKTITDAIHNVSQPLAPYWEWVALGCISRFWMITSEW